MMSTRIYSRWNRKTLNGFEQGKELIWSPSQNVCSGCSVEYRLRGQGCKGFLALVQREMIVAWNRGSGGGGLLPSHLRSLSGWKGDLFHKSECMVYNTILKLEHPGSCFWNCDLIISRASGPDLSWTWNLVGVQKKWVREVGGEAEGRERRVMGSGFWLQGPLTMPCQPRGHNPKRTLKAVLFSHPISFSTHWLPCSSVC